MILGVDVAIDEDLLVLTTATDRDMRSDTTRKKQNSDEKSYKYSTAHDRVVVDRCSGYQIHSRALVDDTSVHGSPRRQTFTLLMRVSLEGHSNFDALGAMKVCKTFDMAKGNWIND